MADSQKEFVSEAEDLLRETEDRLLDLRESLASGGNPDVLNAVFRSMHTLKGLSGLFSLKGISGLSHAMETLLDELRLGKRELTDETIAFILRNLDRLKTLVSEVSGWGAESSSVDDALEEIKRFREGGAASGADAGKIPGVPDEISRVLSEYEEHRLRTNLKEGRALVVAGKDFELDTFEQDLKAITEGIGSIGELIATMPKASETKPGCLGFDLVIGLKVSREEAGDALEGMTVRELVAAKGSVRELVEAKKAVSSPVQPAQARKTSDAEGGQDAGKLKSGSSTVRVDIGKLDAILNTVGELVLAKGAIGRIGADIADTFGFHAYMVDFQRVVKILEKRLSELQNQILEIRMVPVGQIFSRLNRVVRRYTQDRGKEINLELYGEETEIDKLLAEEVIDPLMHLIRNAIDHGIEPQDKRIAAGKPERGLVVLRAFPRGNHVVFQITDDGGGIRADKVYAKAVEKGLITAGQELNKDDIVKLIFMPGFSTADKVSETSGRGVGMDVVKEKVASLGGFVDIETEEGKGSTFYVTIPITLAIIKAILVSVAGELMAIPLASTSETMQIETKKIQHVEGKEVLELRGEMLPLVRLADTFQIPGREAAPTSCFVVVVGFGGRRIGMLVDDLVGQQEVVIKSLGAHLEGIRGIAGAAEVGKHKVVLVLDVEALMEEAMSRFQRLKAGV
ncbi:MAG: chemotaxis protein CheA [Nitrospirae bacterium]|nr:chemotaxis protein CheA [Nitrospirota bacterium]